MNVGTVTKELDQLARATVCLLLALSIAGFLPIHPYLDIFVEFRVLYLPTALVLLLWLAARRDRAGSGAAGIALCINVSAIAPWLDTAPPPCTPQIKVLSINAFGTISSRDALLAQIERDGPDIVFVSELAPDLLERISERFPHRVWFSEAPENAILTKYSVSSANYFHSPGDRTQLNAVLVTDAGPLRVLGAHPPPPYSAEPARNRDATIEQLARIAGASEEPVLLLGDLNVTMFSARVRPLEEAGLVHARSRRGVNATWPSFSPFRIPLDHILHSRHLQTCELAVGETFGSDHLPLQASLAWALSER